ncbi:MAG TPA: phenylalanine--tRNA ligase subunit beta [Lactobacillaceae bacterium]|jgi:phenylalanyl-tRNA synthetase beta chain
MKISLTWLNDYLNGALDLTPEAVNALAERIARTSVEIDENETLAKGQSGLVLARVVAITEHPDSDHMVITHVDAGGEELVQVVTGAPNVAEGQLVILAQVGAKIWDSEKGELVKLRKAKLRGVESFGMLVALQEIGFDNKIAPKDFEAGIFVLPSDAGQVGDDALAALGMHEPVLDTSLTPNRADMLSMIGTAYEFGAMLDVAVTLPNFDLVEGERRAADQISASAPDDLAPNYSLRVINDVTIADSPLWLQKRLWNAGIRPINNVVDVTNYIMWLYGQPLHAFDLDQLGNQVGVRLAHDGEQLVTLDGQTRDLRPDEDIVITAGDAPVAMAGVMGGQSTEVTGQTVNVALESAIFNPSLVRASARRHDLHSAASQRFERGVNWDAQLLALDHAAALLAELAGGQVAAGVVNGAQTQREAVVIELPLARVNGALGTNLTVADVSAIFDRLAFDYTVDGDVWTVNVPARKADIALPADLIEEIARLYGYDNLPVTLPTGPTTPGHLTTTQKIQRASRHTLESLGLNQAISYVLTTPNKAKLFSESAADVVALDYPMSSDRTTTRQNLLAGLLDDVAYNNARSVENVALYEQGRVFFADGVLPREVEHVAGVWSGNVAVSQWQKAVRAVDFYDIKGVVEQYLTTLGVADVRFVAANDKPNMHPGQTAAVFAGDVYLGFVGQLHPSLLADLKLPRVFGFELDFAAILNTLGDLTQYVPVSRFPQITRDVALLVSDAVTHAQVDALIRATAGDKLVDVTLFDVYRGEHVPAGQQSLAYTLTYQDQNATLVEENVNADFAKVIAALESEFGAEIR